MRFYDAHNHLQDERFGARQAELLVACVEVGVRRMVVNGSCETDWPLVLALARQHPQVVPSFGYHPWYVGERTPEWNITLARLLDQVPSAVGEIGLDRWKPGLAYAGQEEVFLSQLRLATERDRPASIHCLRAWGRLYELLAANPRPSCGFLLHSYGGPAEMVVPLARLGAYFGFPGYFARPGKERQRSVFRAVPPDRLLVETDAPDQSLPEALTRFSLAASPADEGHRAAGSQRGLLSPVSHPPLNHPANVVAVHAFAAEMLGEPLSSLAARIEENFQRLFGGL
jgi:TatD DNase family protein